MCNLIWFVAIRSGEGRSTATFWHASWWTRKDKTTNGLPPSSGDIQTKDCFNEKPAIPLRKQHVAEDRKSKSPSSRGTQRAFNRAIWTPVVGSEGKDQRSVLIMQLKGFSAGFASARVEF